MCICILVGEIDTVIYPAGAARALKRGIDGRGLVGRVRSDARLLTAWRRRFAGIPRIVEMPDRPIFRRSMNFNQRAGQLSEDAKLQPNKELRKRAARAGGYHGLGDYRLY